MSKNKSPESAAYDLLKGRKVVAVYTYCDGGAERGILQWVDVFTIGINDKIIYKSSLASVAADVG